jgi:hypothetical protein
VRNVLICEHKHTVTLPDRLLVKLDGVDTKLGDVPNGIKFKLFNGAWVDAVCVPNRIL